MSKKKSSKSAIARRYARALFDLATEKNTTEKIEADLAKIGRALKDSKELSAVLKNSALSKSTIHEVFSGITEKFDIQKITKDFLSLLGSNRRLVILPEIIKEFNALVSAMRGEIKAEVITALPLTDKHRNEIKNQIKQITGKNVEFEEKIDKEILGGIVIKVGSQMLDDSVQGRLERLRVFQKQQVLN